jgi:hypothetical protein
MAHTDSILAMYFQSNALDRQSGRDWYNNAHQICVDLGIKYNVSIDIVAGVIAALSPNNKWQSNIVDAEIMIRAWAADVDYNDVKVATYTINKYKAATILDCELNRDQIVKVLRGNKVIAFFLCIASNGISDTPCIDGHAYNVWNGTVSNLKEVPKLSDKTFRTIQDAYRDAAIVITNVTGCYHSAAQVQAITWVAYRRLYKGVTV